jgi:hypothetical protein
MPTQEYRFGFRAFKAGSGFQTKASDHGTVEIENGEAPFQLLSAWPDGPGNETLPRFKISCRYINAAQQQKDGPFVEVGKQEDDAHQSPPNGAANSAYIMAFRVELFGHNASLYSVRYKVHIVQTPVTDPTFHGSLGESSGADGSWAGHLDMMPGSFVWINRITFTVGAHA